jgi:2-oxoglutarate ferredoxin oxidoreductase subunit alpha
MHGRNGEAPLPIIAACSPADCFNAALEACRIAVEYMTPVMLLSDGYIANGAEPWQFPQTADLPKITATFITEKNGGDKFLPYKRDENLSRPWAIPGTKALEHRIGGLEKQHETGNINYENENHQFMVRMRESKVNKVADSIPLQKMDNGNEKGKLLVIGWGSTYGAIKMAVIQARAKGYDVSHAQVRYMNPFPKNLGEILYGFEKILVPEMNTGQFLSMLRSKYLVPAEGLNKIKGIPFSSVEIMEKIESMIA